ncbi:hypothetical protein OUZ56_009158 [Daphnia magna]|nr:hypothetical protein OUZ56_009158 [Daphnia magna]
MYPSSFIPEEELPAWSIKRIYKTNRFIYYACFIIFGLATVYYVGKFFKVTDIKDRLPASSSHKYLVPQCVPINVTFCSNYTHTFYPNGVGDKSEDDFIRSSEYLRIIIDSNCHPEIGKFICLVTQPECRPEDKTTGPSRKLCQEIVDKCEIHFWDILKKERTMLKCEQYIDS